MTLKFTVPGPPRTKKTHNRLVSFGCACRTCGRQPFQKIVPSEAFTEWFGISMSYAPLINQRLFGQGLDTPIKQSVAVRAIFYREANVGDLLGYEQALADWLQAPRHHKGKQTRTGAGIIDDDRQIVSWDGSRLDKDAAKPRIDVEITIISDMQPELFV